MTARAGPHDAPCAPTPTPIARRVRLVIVKIKVWKPRCARKHTASTHVQSRTGIEIGRRERERERGIREGERKQRKKGGEEEGGRGVNCMTR